MGLLDEPQRGVLPTVRVSPARPTSMALTAADLRGIADVVEKLSKSGVRVESARVGQHRIELEWHDDQRDGSWYTVTSIRPVDGPKVYR